MILTAEGVQTIALVFTLGVLIWYTIETHKLRRETAKQTELQLSPFITIQGNKYRNIGHSTALNIKMDRIETDYFYVTFQTMNLIEPGAIKGFRFMPEPKTKDDEKRVQIFKDALESEFPFFDKNFLSQGFYILTVRYNNIENHPYLSKIKVHCEERRMELLKTGRV